MPRLIDDLGGSNAMGHVIDKERVRTVGELLAVLQQFPADLPIAVGIDPAAVVYLVDGASAMLCIDGDPFEDDF